jgi:hypothetical protein
MISGQQSALSLAPVHGTYETSTTRGFFRRERNTTRRRNMSRERQEVTIPSPSASDEFLRRQVFFLFVSKREAKGLNSLTVP